MPATQNTATYTVTTTTVTTTTVTTTTGEHNERIMTQDLADALAGVPPCPPGTCAHCRPKKRRVIKIVKSQPAKPPTVARVSTAVARLRRAEAQQELDDLDLPNHLDEIATGSERWWSYTYSGDIDELRASGDDQQMQDGEPQRWNKSKVPVWW